MWIFSCLKIKSFFLKKVGVEAQERNPMGKNILKEKETRECHQENRWEKNQQRVISRKSKEEGRYGAKEDQQW